MIVFIKFVVSLTIVNDDPSLMIVNDDPSLTIVNDNPSLTIVNDDPFVNDRQRREETDLKGISTYH